MPIQPFFDPEVFGLPDSPGVTTQPERAAMFTFYGMQPLVGLVQVIPNMGTVLESDLDALPTRGRRGCPYRTACYAPYALRWKSGLG